MFFFEYFFHFLYKLHSIVLYVRYDVYIWVCLYKYMCELRSQVIFSFTVWPLFMGKQLEVGRCLIRGMISIYNFYSLFLLPRFYTYISARYNSSIDWYKWWWWWLWVGGGGGGRRVFLFNHRVPHIFLPWKLLFFYSSSFSVSIRRRCYLPRRRCGSHRRRRLRICGV